MTGSTLNSYTTTGITIGSTAYPSPLTITATGTINATGKYGVYAGISVASPTLVNHGAIAAYNGVVFFGAGANITNTGIIQGTTNTGIFVFNDSTVDNAGTITGALVGANLRGGGYLNNQGTIAGGTAGVEMINAGTVLNAGTIETTYTTSNVSYAISIVGETAYVTNTGTAALIASAKGGVYIKSTAGVVVNAGTIESTTGAGSGIFIREIASTYTGTIQNNGTAALISGYDGIQVLGGQGVVTNSGTINGTNGDGVSLAAGGYVNNQNLITGAGYGVQLGGAGTVVNTGTISGTVTNIHKYAVELTAGGTVNNNATQALISGQKGIKITGGAGTILNEGTVTGMTGTGIYLVDGGTINNLGTASLIETEVTRGTGIIGSGAAATITNAGTITGDGNAIFLNAGGYILNDNIINGGTGGVAIGGGDGTIVNEGTISGTRYAVNVNGTGYIINHNQIIGATYGVYIGTGTVTNTGTITGKSSHGVFVDGSGTVNNTGTITGAPTASTYAHIGVLIDGAGYVGNTAANALISGDYGVAVQYGLGTVVNAGSISGVNGIGVYLLDGGTVTNTGTAATISGQDTGIKILGTTGLVSNTGTITGGTGGGVGLLLSGGAGTVDNTGTAALITGHYGIAITSATGTVLNEGTVSGSNIGVELAEGGTINNTGTAALIYGAGTGVVVNTQAGTLNNTGTISAQAVAAFFDGGAYINNQNVITGGEIGVAIGGGGTVMNTGSIYSTSYSSAAYYAVYITGPQATIINSGTNALISSAKGGIFAESTMGVVTNDGAIVSTTGTGNGVVVYESVASSGSFTVQNNGPAGYIAGYDGIKFTNLVGIVDNAGLIIGAQKVGVDLASGGTVSNTGTQAGIFGKSIGVDIGGAQAKLTNAGIISGNTNAVELYATTSNLLIADVGAEFVGGVAANKSAANTLELAQGPAAGPGAIYGIGSQFTGFGTIDFDTKTEWTLGGDIAGLAVGQVINGFTFGDTIDLSSGGLVAEVSRLSVSPTLTESFADNVLTLYSSGAEFAALTLNEAPSITSANFEVFSDGNGGTDIVMDMPCFCTGTKILTPTGEVNVEDLQVGDTVITVRDNGPVTGRVTWTGRRSLDIARHPNPASMHPVRIIAGAFAPGLPERDLRVSPHHALYIDGALMEAISLVNGATVIQEFGTRFVTYHHFALETHDVILAEGLPAETYLETGHLTMFEGGSTMVLHPNFQILGDADFCAPMIRAGAKLEAARARLLARAAFLGFTQTDDIDLTIHPNHLHRRVG